MILTETHLSAEEAFTNQVFVQTGLHWGSVHPGLHLALPLETKEAKITDYTLGFTLSYTR